MDTASEFSFENLFRFAVSDLAKAVSERNGDDEAQKFARCQAAVHMIMGFLPRDVIEVVLAGHCVMFHEALKAEIRDSLRAEAGTSRRTLIGLNKAFNDDLDRLERYRQRAADGSRDAPDAPPAADVPTEPGSDISAPPVANVRATLGEAAIRAAAPEMNRAARRQAARAEMRAAATAARAASRRASPVPPVSTSGGLPQAAQRPDGPPIDQPSHEAVAKCRASPEAMTAVADGDPIRFTHALGVASPGEASLAAAKAPGSPFDPLVSGPWPSEQLPGSRRAG